MDRAMPVIGFYYFFIVNDKPSICLLDKYRYLHGRNVELGKPSNLGYSAVEMYNWLLLLVLELSGGVDSY